MEDMNIFDYLFNLESNMFKLYDFVVLKERTEITPNFWINGDVIGVVIDINAGESYKVKFEGQGAYWVEGRKLKRK
jgi:hypothetical protein